MSLEQFMSRFKYDTSKVFNLGIERELFLASKGVIGPHTPRFLAAIERGIPCATPFHGETYMGVEPDAFGFELSACQLEMRVGPCVQDNLYWALAARDTTLKIVLEHLGLEALHRGVAPKDMPLDVYPDPAGRYQKLVKDMPVKTLRAACRVAGTHVHVGMRNQEHALRVYNHSLEYLDELKELGDESNGERLAIYQQMAPDCDPKPFATWEDYYREAVRAEFSSDPRKCWTWIRISVHGTIEFRMFGATSSKKKIVRWANRCLEICKAA